MTLVDQLTQALTVLLAEHRATPSAGTALAEAALAAARPSARLFCSACGALLADHDPEQHVNEGLADVIAHDVVEAPEGGGREEELAFVRLNAAYAAAYRALQRGGNTKEARIAAQNAAAGAR